ncbi:MAG: NTP transferase domain-containing protein [Bifidobacteriaceae bacterium]|nr:NTP transferase domain-containing protein [Bifidobacteriaceae bacterium]
MTNLSGFYPIIPAGGAGKRLWPISTPARPKFLLDLTGEGRTLLQQTWDRLVPLSRPDRIVVVTGQAHAAAVAAQLDGLASSNLLSEPGPKDSLPAIALAAAVIERRHGDVVAGSFAADHVIRGAEAFNQAVEEAYLAAQEGFIATIGLAPTEASTAYGYIESGERLGLLAAPGVHLVKAFKEKPDQATAAAYLAAGGFAWNAGMFMFQVRVLLGHLRRLRPDLASPIERLADAIVEQDQAPTVPNDSPAGALMVARPSGIEQAEEAWREMPPVAIDHAIAEVVAGEGGLATVAGTFEWSDVGDYASLARLIQADSAGARSLQLAGGPAPQLIDSPGSFAVTAAGRRLTVLGVPGVVVVDTPEGTLVLGQDQAQRVKELAEPNG